MNVYPSVLRPSLAPKDLYNFQTKNNEDHSLNFLFCKFYIKGIILTILLTGCLTSSVNSLNFPNRLKEELVDLNVLKMRSESNVASESFPSYILLMIS